MQKVLCFLYFASPYICNVQIWLCRVEYISQRTKAVIYLWTSHIIVNMWKSYLCVLLNICTADEFKSTWNVYSKIVHEAEMTVEELNHYKSSRTDFIPVKLIQTDIKTLHLDICELTQILLGWGRTQLMHIQLYIKTFKNEFIYIFFFNFAPCHSTLIHCVHQCVSQQSTTTH